MHSNTSAFATAIAIAQHYVPGARPQNGFYRIPCPAHKGTGNNLAIADAPDGGLILKCWSAGCSYNDILSAFKADGLTIDRKWTYPNGKVIRRTDSPNRPKDMGGSSKGSTKSVPLLVTGDDGADFLIVITEGESDRDAVLSAALPDVAAACFVGGWQMAGNADYSAVSGRKVAIWPDHDEHGAKALEGATAACWKVGAIGVLAVPYVGAAGSGMGAADLTPDAVAYFLRRLGQEEDDGQPEDAGFTFYDAADWIKDVGPIEWLVEGWFPKQSKILLSAGSKIGKSWLVTALMKASCEGDCLFGLPVPDVTPIWFFTETDRRSFYNDCDRQNFVVPSGKIKVIPLYENISESPAHFARNFIKEYNKAWIQGTAPNLVIIDVLARWLPSGDINDYSKMTKVLESLEEVSGLVKRQGGTVWVNHHNRKGTAGSSIEAALGSTAIVGFFDQIAILTKVDDDLRKLQTGGRYPENRATYTFDGKRMVIVDENAETDDDILDCLELGDHTAKEIQQYISDNEGKPILRTVQARLKVLVEEGLVLAIGKARAATYRIANRANP